MKSIRKVLASVKRADHEFNLFNQGDRIVIGVSGGKDSLVLVESLLRYQRFPHTNFEIFPVMLDLGFPNTDTKKIKEYFSSIGLELIVADASEVYPILKAQQKNHAHLPCSICSRMKKAAINKVANELKCNKVAFAHHADDAIETLFMNEIFGGRLATFAPKMHLENADIVFIRPLIYVRESDILETASALELPVMKSPCPSNEHTMREEVKKLLNGIYAKHPYAKENFLTMLTNYEKADLWFDELNYTIPNTTLSVREVITKNDAIQMIKIREKVFVEELKVSFEDEIDLDDLSSRHFLMLDNGKAIGTIRAVINEHEVHLGRVAILKENRGFGNGGHLLKYMLDFIEHNIKTHLVSLNAISSVRSFYEKHGFVPEGNEFDECNIPHIRMIKEVKNK